MTPKAIDDPYLQKQKKKLSDKFASQLGFSIRSLELNNYRLKSHENIAESFESIHSMMESFKVTSFVSLLESKSRNLNLAFAFQKIKQNSISIRHSTKQNENYQISKIQQFFNESYLKKKDKFLTTIHNLTFQKTLKLEDEVNKLKNLIQENQKLKNNEINLLNDKYNAYVAELSSKINELQNSITQNDLNKNSEIEQLNENAKNDIAQLQNKIAELQNSILENERLKNEDISQLSENAKNEMLQLQNSIEELKKVMSENEMNKNNEIEQLNEKAKNEISELQLKIQELKNLIEKNQLDKNNEIDLLNENAKSNISQLQNKIAELQNSILENERLKSEEINQLSESAKNEISKLQSKIKELENEIEENEKYKNNQLGSIEEQAKNQITDFRLKIKELQKSMSENEAIKNNEIDQINENAKNNIAQLQNKIAELQNSMLENERLKNEEINQLNENTKNQILQLQSNVKDLENLMEENMNAKNNEFVQLNDKSKTKKKALKSKVKELENLVAETEKTKLNELDQINSSSNNYILSLQSKIKELENSIEEKEKLKNDEISQLYCKIKKDNFLRKLTFANNEKQRNVLIWFHAMVKNKPNKNKETELLFKKMAFNYKVKQLDCFQVLRYPTIVRHQRQKTAKKLTEIFENKIKENNRIVVNKLCKINDKLTTRTEPFLNLLHDRVGKNKQIGFYSLIKSDKNTPDQLIKMNRLINLISKKKESEDSQMKFFSTMKLMSLLLDSTKSGKQLEEVLYMYDLYIQKRLALDKNNGPLMVKKLNLKHTNIVINNEINKKKIENEIYQKNIDNLNESTRNLSFQRESEIKELLVRRKLNFSYDFELKKLTAELFGSSKANKTDSLTISQPPDMNEHRYNVQDHSYSKNHDIEDSVNLHKNTSQSKIQSNKLASEKISVHNAKNNTDLSQNRLEKLNAFKKVRDILPDNEVDANDYSLHDEFTYSLMTSKPQWEDSIDQLSNVLNEIQKVANEKNKKNDALENKKAIQRQMSMKNELVLIDLQDNKGLLNLEKSKLINRNVEIQHEVEELQSSINKFDVTKSSVDSLDNNKLETMKSVYFRKQQQIQENQQKILKIDQDLIENSKKISELTGKINSFKNKKLSVDSVISKSQSENQLLLDFINEIKSEITFSTYHLINISTLVEITEKFKRKSKEIEVKDLHNNDFINNYINNKYLNINNNDINTHNNDINPQEIVMKEMSTREDNIKNYNSRDENTKDHQAKEFSPKDFPLKYLNSKDNFFEGLSEGQLKSFVEKYLNMNEMKFNRMNLIVEKSKKKLESINLSDQIELINEKMESSYNDLHSNDELSKKQELNLDKKHLIGEIEKLETDLNSLNSQIQNFDNSIKLNEDFITDHFHGYEDIVLKNKDHFNSIENKLKSTDNYNSADNKFKSTEHRNSTSGDNKLKNFENSRNSINGEHLSKNTFLMSTRMDLNQMDTVEYSTMRDNILNLSKSNILEDNVKTSLYYKLNNDIREKLGNEMHNNPQVTFDELMNFLIQKKQMYLQNNQLSFFNFLKKSEIENQIKSNSCMILDYKEKINENNSKTNSLKDILDKNKIKIFKISSDLKIDLENKLNRNRKSTFEGDVDMKNKNVQTEIQNTFYNLGFKTDVSDVVSLNKKLIKISLDQMIDESIIPTKTRNLILQKVTIYSNKFPSVRGYKPFLEIGKDEFIENRSPKVVDDDLIELDLNNSMKENSFNLEEYFPNDNVTRASKKNQVTKRQINFPNIQLNSHSYESLLQTVRVDKILNKMQKPEIKKDIQIIPMMKMIKTNANFGESKKSNAKQLLKITDQVIRSNANVNFYQIKLATSMSNLRKLMNALNKFKLNTQYQQLKNLKDEVSNERAYSLLELMSRLVSRRKQQGFEKVKNILDLIKKRRNLLITKWMGIGDTNLKKQLKVVVQYWKHVSKDNIYNGKILKDMVLKCQANHSLIALWRLMLHKKREYTCKPRVVKGLLILLNAIDFKLKKKGFKQILLTERPGNDFGTAFAPYKKNSENISLNSEENEIENLNKINLNAKSKEIHYLFSYFALANKKLMMQYFFKFLNLVKSFPVKNRMINHDLKHDHDENSEDLKDQMTKFLLEQQTKSHSVVNQKESVIRDLKHELNEKDKHLVFLKNYLLNFSLMRIERIIQRIVHDHHDKSKWILINSLTK